MERWFKSSYSGGDNNCVEVAHTPWHTASYSVERVECIEGSKGPLTGVRDTQNREIGALFFDTNEWQAFLGTARDELR